MLYFSLRILRSLLSLKQLPYLPPQVRYSCSPPQYRPHLSWTGSSYWGLCHPPCRRDSEVILSLAFFRPGWNRRFRRIGHGHHGDAIITALRVRLFVGRVSVAW